MKEFGSIPEPSQLDAPSAPITIGWDLGKEASLSFAHGITQAAEPNAALWAAAHHHAQTVEAE